MAYYSDVVWTDRVTKTPVAGVQISVSSRATPNVLAAITDNNGSPLGNPVATGADGLFYFNAPTGDYILSYKLASATRPFRSETVSLNDAIRGDLALASGTNLVGATRAETGASVETLTNRLAALPVYTTSFGFGVPGNTPAQNLAALKNAKNATALGGKLINPEGIDATVDVTGGLSNACDFNRAITFENNGIIRTNGHAVQANPCYPIKVSGDDVNFTGSGTFAGDGSINDANSGTIATHPGLIYVTGKRFSFAPSLTIDTPPKVGIALVSTTGASIGFKWKGGPTAYGSTSYFGVNTTGGGFHTFHDIDAPEGPNGERVVNMIFSGGANGDSNNCTVRNCNVDAWEKLFYGHGSGHVVTNNRGRGKQTDWIRLWGSNCIAAFNVCTEGAGGVTILDGAGCWVHHNSFTGCTQTGVNVQRNDPAYVGGFSYTRIENNYLRGAGGSQTYGVQFITDGLSSTGVRITGNDIGNFGLNPGQGAVRFEATAPHVNASFEIANNIISDDTQNGILVTRGSNGRVRANIGTVGTYAIVESGSTNISYTNNEFSAGTPGISGLAGTSQPTGNRYTTGLRKGKVTLVAGAATVNTIEVMAGDIIRLSRQASGGTLGNLSVGTITAGTSFVINSSSATETSVVAWEIEH